ncbi:hypothetical protein D3C72_2127800 [compost metagenome]
MLDQLVAQHDLDTLATRQRDIGGAEIGQDEVIVLDDAEELCAMRIVRREAVIDVAGRKELRLVGGVANAWVT